MKILSIDVGIKNLALCLFCKSPDTGEEFIVKKWDVVNLSEKEVFKCCFQLCNSQVKYKKDETYYCLKHSKKQTLQIPKLEQTPAFINKQKIQSLYEIATKYNIKYEPKAKKVELVKLINEYIQKTYFSKIDSIKASDVDLFSIGVNIKNKLNDLFKDEANIDYVIIENQIGPLAIRMKTIQGMIVQYFVMSNLNVKNIEFISASNKLKDCDVKDKEKYSDRKKLGITRCQDILTNDVRFNEHINYFNGHKKKDDLSDAFLQGLWFINNKKL